MAPWEPGVHPFSLSGPDFLALCLVTPDQHIVWHEQYLHYLSLTEENHSRHGRNISSEEIQRDLDMHLETLAETHGVSHSLLQVVYMHKHEKQLNKPIATRFTLEDDDQDVTAQNIQKVLGETHKKEIEKQIQGKIGTQLKSLNLIIHYLPLRVSGLSQPYSTACMQSQSQAIIQRRLTIATLTGIPRVGMRLVADLDGQNAEEAYWCSTDGTKRTTISASRDLVVAALLYSNKELMDMHNLHRVKSERDLTSDKTARMSLERNCTIFAHACEIGIAAFRCAYQRQRAENSAFMGNRTRKWSHFSDSLLNHAKA